MLRNPIHSQAYINRKDYKREWTYCSNWCLSVNLSKTNVVIFNKAGKCLKHPVYFKGTLIRSDSL